MNKKVLKVAFVAAIAMVSAINVFNAQKAEMLSDVALANVEALAELEGDKPGSGSSIGRWIVTIYNPMHWKCDQGGGMCCPDYDC